MVTKAKSQAAEKIIGPTSRIFGSKGQYRWDFPQNLVVFNSNLCDASGKKIWYGDIDITDEEEKIKLLAKTLKTTIYVLYEMDARFENEEAPKLDNAVYWTDGKSANTRADYADLLERVDGRLMEKKIEKEDLPIKAQKYDQSEFVLKFSLGDLKRFASRSKKNPPIVKFYEWVVSEIGPKVTMKTLNIFSVHISMEAGETLKSIAKKWIKIVMPYGTEYRIEKELSWHWFDLGPSEFYGTPDWADKSYVYIRGDYIRENVSEEDEAA